MRTRARIMLAGLVLGALLAGGVGWAAIPSADGTIEGCYRTSTDDQKGQLRVVEDPASCRSNELAIQWSREGQRGDTGPQGIRGPQGEAGATGPAGPKGDKGDTGAAGRDGTNGADGLPGANGVDGAPGAPGAPCLPTNPACVGPKGDTGDTGPQGPPGPGGGNVYTASTSTVREWTGLAALTAISVSLPAGSYLVNARATVENSGASGLTAVDVIRCRLGGDIAGMVSKPLAAFRSDKWMLFSLVHLANPGQVLMACELDGGNSNGIWRVREAAIVALQTGAVTAQ